MARRAEPAPELQGPGHGLGIHRVLKGKGRCHVCPCHLAALGSGPGRSSCLSVREPQACRWALLVPLASPTPGPRRTSAIPGQFRWLLGLHRLGQICGLGVPWAVLCERGGAGARSTHLTSSRLRPQGIQALWGVHLPVLLKYKILGISSTSVWLSAPNELGGGVQTCL